MVLKLVLMFMAFCAHLCDSYSILVIFGHPGKSHFDVFAPLFQQLANKGHNVTILGHVRIANPNINFIPLEDHQPMSQVININQISQDGFYTQENLGLLIQFAAEHCPKYLKNRRFQDFLKQNHKFDLILVELFNTNCYYGLINKLQVPFIGLSSCVPLPWQGKWFGATPNPAYVQNLFGGYPTPMSFWNRVENTFVQIYSNLWYELFMAKPGNEWSKKYIGYEAADLHNTSLFLVNTHHTLTGVQPLTPNIIEVGGLHVHNKTAQKPPQHLEDWITNAEAGVIYFNLGSMIKSDTFPEQQRRTFLRAFAKFPQRILWKWENSSMPDKPDNVMIDKWMPQYDILCHPNVKLFLTHGGLLGTIEAAHCGKPVVVMPQFGDQRHNAYAMESNGVGVVLHLQSASEEQIVDAIRKTLEPETMQNAKSLMQKFNDRPLSPMDTAIYWVEHIARHKGGQHMRSKAIDMPFYQVYLLDVIGLIILITFSILLVLYKIIRLILALGKIMTKVDIKHKTS